MYLNQLRTHSWCAFLLLIHTSKQRLSMKSSWYKQQADDPASSLSSEPELHLRKKQRWVGYLKNLCTLLIHPEPDPLRSVGVLPFISVGFESGPRMVSHQRKDVLLESLWQHRKIIFLKYRFSTLLPGCLLNHPVPYVYLVPLLWKSQTPSEPGNQISPEVTRCFYTQ